MSSAAPDLDAPAEGSAFPLPVKLLASLLVGWVATSGLQIAAPLRSADWTLTAALLMGGALALLLLCLWWIWRSRTRVDDVGIRQSWMWPKQVVWTDVMQARVVAIPHLEWLIAPRLVVRARGGLVMVFHVADARVLQTLALRVTRAGLR